MDVIKYYQIGDPLVGELIESLKGGKGASALLIRSWSSDCFPVILKPFEQSSIWSQKQVFD